MSPSKPFIQDEDFTLYVGDALETLRTLPSESVHCCVTSPPYWGLRDYGTGSWEGGDADCDHRVREDARVESSTLGGGKETTGHQREGFKESCPRCGARRVDNQLGLEPTPEEYVTRMVEVFREVRRVLRRDGTCWLNIGDSYAASARTGNAERFIEETKQGTPGHVPNAWNAGDRTPTPPGLKPKDLVGIPWRIAFALQADGWYLRSDIIWSKPNPMPESVTDRPTKAHEYVFLLSKSPRYYFDAEGVREEYAPKTLTHRGGGKAAGKVGQQDGLGKVASGNFGDWDRTRTAYAPPRPQDETLDGSDGETPRGPDGRRKTTVQGQDGSLQHRDGERWPNGGRNIRSVWEIATQPYPEAHFATFPEALVDRIIRAGTSERGCCPECGAPWVRETERPSSPGRDTRTPGEHTPVGNGKLSGPKMQEWLDANPRVTTGWKPSCTCDPWNPTLPDHRGLNNVRSPVPCVVLDPFMGSGTTALVARKLGRKSIGIELSPEYAELAARRLQQLSLLA